MERGVSAMVFSVLALAVLCG